jgi:UDP-xylose/UDP-N-acetylglucosamine transporter B4
LEAVLRDHPKSGEYSSKSELRSLLGTFLTFAQFVYVAIQNISSQLELPRTAKGARIWGVPGLKKRKVPMKRWLVQVLLFLGVSLSEQGEQRAGYGDVLTYTSFSE